MSAFHRSVLCAVLLFGGTSVSCSAADARPDGWTEATHGDEAEPNYDLVFATDRVHTITITIAPGDFAAMQDDLDELLGGSPGDSGGVFPGGDIPDGGGFPGGGELPDGTAACEGLDEGASCELVLGEFTVQGTCALQEDVLTCSPGEMPGGGEVPGGDVPGGGGLSFLSRDPIYVPVEIAYDGVTWWNVGMRYKGNSSLTGSYQAGNGKLAFRLDFDEFEDAHPEIDDQRFHGFKKMTFASGWNDDSLIRDAYVSEVLRDRGIPAARCAFYRVFVDVGEGPRYWGLYTMIEDPADPAMLDSQLGGRGGNLYKPEGTAANWTSFDTESFAKKTNEEEGDWSDIEAAVAALHASSADAAAWREGLEAHFDVERFLTWLAVNTAVQNWDSYGQMAHNYYLYASSPGDPLGWVPWDHNLAMTEGGLGGAPTAGGTGSAVDEVFHANVSADAWPLIRRLLDDPVYAQLYRSKLEHALGGLFDVETGAARMRAMHELIAPFVVGPDGEVEGYSHLSSEQAFSESIDGSGGLAAHIVGRHERVREALAGE